ncbi:MAG: LytTR family DNA-binding domain-containing protein, partial [Pseudomonadota bacterium]
MSGDTALRPGPGPFAQRIGITTAGLSILFAVLAPAASEPLGFLTRLLFWALHIGIGLGLCLLAAAGWLRMAPRLRDWRLVLLAGVTGVLLFAPIAWGLELLFPVGGQSGADSETARTIAAGSWLGAVAVEALELAPPFLATWLVINLEPIAAAMRRDDGGPSSRSFTLAAVEETTDSANEPPRPPHDDPAHAEQFESRLPAAIGDEVLAVSSDLHYLQVVTRRGRAMVLGSLAEVEASYGDAGLRIHRSHWVHLDAVSRLRRTGDRWQVELVNG